jgi:hypothetical protein
MAPNLHSMPLLTISAASQVVKSGYFVYGQNAILANLVRFRDGVNNEDVTNHLHHWPVDSDFFLQGR